MSDERVFSIEESKVIVNMEIVNAWREVMTRNSTTPVAMTKSDRGIS
jgi:hypothetical protein